MEKKLKVEELYECIALLQGFKNEQTEITTIGFVNEKSISEGMRRIGNKTIRKLKENYPEDQFKDILSISHKELYNGILPENYKETGEDNTKLETLKQSKINDLLKDEVIITFEELPDFKALDSRLEERKESLSFDYTYLFDRLFLNY